MIRHLNLNGKIHQEEEEEEVFSSFDNFRSKNDHRIVKDDHVKMEVVGDTVKLIIAEVAPSDAGTYELVAENALGAIDCTARLTVHCMYNHLLSLREKNI